MKARLFLLGAALALAGACGLFWALTSNRPTAAPVEPAPPIQKEAVIAPDPKPITSVQPTTPAKNPEPAKAEIPVYEAQIDQILRTNVGETQTAKMLINLLPNLPEEGQVEAAQHIANLLPDSDYQSVLPTLLNPNTPESVSSVLFTDLMNRSDATKLNAFLEVAKLPNHPNQEEALNDLQIFLDQDLGTDWPKWKAAINAYVAKQAAEQ